MATAPTLTSTVPTRYDSDSVQSSSSSSLLHTVKKVNNYERTKQWVEDQSKMNGDLQASLRFQPEPTGPQTWEFRPDNLDELAKKYNIQYFYTDDAGKLQYRSPKENEKKQLLDQVWKFCQEYNKNNSTKKPLTIDGLAGLKISRVEENGKTTFKLSIPGEKDEVSLEGKDLESLHSIVPQFKDPKFRDFIMNLPQNSASEKSTGSAPADNTESTAKVVGIKNTTGSNCFMNAALQLMMRDKKLVAFLKTRPTGFDALSNFVNIYSAKTNNEVIDDPGTLAAVRGWISAQLPAEQMASGQQDTTTLYRAIEIALEKYSKLLENAKNEAEIAKLPWMHYSTKTERGPKVTRNSVSPFTLILPSATEKTELPNLIPGSFDEGLKFNPVPETLQFNIPRVQQDGSKLNLPIQFPQEFSLDKEYVLDNKDQPYELSAIICHYGTGRGGHYKTFVFQGNECYLCNEDEVRQIKLDDNIDPNKSFTYRQEIEQAAVIVQYELAKTPTSPASSSDAGSDRESTPNTHEASDAGDHQGSEAGDGEDDAASSQAPSVKA